MINKILVPVDFSEYSTNATEAAVSLAHLFEAELILYYVKQDDVLNATEKLDIFESQMDFSNLTVTKIDGSGSFLNALLQLIPTNKIDLMVIGSHGTSGSNDSVIGSNALKLLRKSVCPTLVVKNKLNNFSLNKLVFVSNFDYSNFSSFKQLIKIMQPFKSDIHLLNIDTPGFFSDSNTIVSPAMQAFQDYAIEQGFASHVYRENHAYIESGIQHFVEKIQPDLVVIPTHQRSDLTRIFVSSIAEALINYVEVPVMTLKIN